MKSLLHSVNKVITADVVFQISVALRDVHNLMAAGEKAFTL